MSGKAYTMKEMKAIVEYLKEHKAYNEIKGRKMWMDFEKSKILDRTWQSLKETFLKRVLPDIHNPYYQCSVTQISSFRNGYDVEEKINNKLEIRTVGEESGANIEPSINTEEPSTSNGNASGIKSGEDIINTKNLSLHRSSVETVAIKTCYDTAEDIQRELEGKDNDENDSSQSKQKSLRDFITYSEPLTPMIQEGIDNFASDEESVSGIRMKIVEDINIEKKARDINIQINEGPIEISSDTEDVVNLIDLPDQPKHNKTHQDNEAAKENSEKINKTGQDRQNETETLVQEVLSTKDVVNVHSNIEFASEQVIIVDSDSIKEIETSNDREENIGTETGKDKPETTNNIEEIATTQNTSINTTDSTIPNNQEALKTQPEMVSQTEVTQIQSKTTENYKEVLLNPTENGKEIPPKSTEKEKQSKSKSNESHKRKRASSQDLTVSKDKRRLIKNAKPVSVSDTDVGIKNLNSKLLRETDAKPKAKKLKTSDVGNKEKNNTDENTKELEKVTEVDETLENVTERIDLSNISPDIENPCLKSVSLYDEQFTTTKYSESSDAGVPEHKETRQGEQNKQTNKNNSDNDVLQLKSHSESESEHIVKRKTSPARTGPTKSEREKVLANVFGFSRGAISHSRKRRVSYRKSAHRHSRARLSSSGSSEWISESEAEYVSPPRGRKERHSKKYLKPKSARIFSLEEDGGLFVMYGKKIYPLVKDGKLIKNYVTYAPERDSGGEDESYWKLKYMEEKKRTAQLTKLLHRSEDALEPSIETYSEVNLTKPSPPKKQKMSVPQTETKPECCDNIPNKISPVAQNKPVIQTEPAVQNKTVKIKITKQNEELELEGHWSQLHPVLDHVVQIFHKEVEPKTDSKSLASSEQSKLCLSGLSTPIIPHMDQAVHEKVRTMESQIFREIEARDKLIERSDTPQSLSTDSSKVTQRRAQPKRSKISTSAPTTPEIDKLNSSNKVEKEQNEKGSGDVENGTSPTAVARRITRTSKNAFYESTDKNESKINTRTKKSKESAGEVEDADVRYKFPSPSPSGKKSTRAASKTTKLTKTKNRYVKRTSAVISSMNTAIMNIIESSQGYQDSDISPPKLIKKRKFRRNTISGKIRQLSRQNMRRRSQLNYYEMSDQSSNSCPGFSLISKTIQKQGFSSNSDIYRSESLQLLMPKAKTTIGINPKSEVFTAFAQQLNRIINNDDVRNIERTVDRDSHTVANISNGNSSSIVSLPLSPVLSIGQNLSIDKKSLKGFFDNNHIIHEHQTECINDEIVITNDDVSMILMGQDCDNQGTTTNNAKQHNENSSNAMVTDSILSKLGTVNLNQDNPTISDSLHQKIRNLLLESTKKKPIPQIIEPKGSDEMDVDTEVEIHENNRSNKRCSTPLKRQASKKTKKKNPGMEAFIQEEHTDSCSNAKRSCPPLTYDPSNVEYLNPESANTAKKPRNSRGRKKKDNIIKVKILRPKARSHSRELLTEQPRNREATFKHGDSGINETELSIITQQLDRSVELIHNHSETCLQTDECLDNSVEYVESNRSLICLTDSDLSNNIEPKNPSGTDHAKHTQCELLIGNNGASNSCNVIQSSPVIANRETLSRESLDSLITEDLSEPDQEQNSDITSKWYLLSDDENTNTNLPQNLDFGSDLGKLFPVACAVPNLSTITEMSKENDNKPLDLDGDTRNNLLSQSLFDSNF